MKHIIYLKQLLWEEENLTGYSLLDNRRNENVFEELKSRWKKLHSVSKNGKIMSAELKTLDTQKNSLTNDLFEENLDDH